MLIITKRYVHTAIIQDHALQIRKMYFIHEQEQVTRHAADHKTTTQEVMCVVLEPFDGREPPILHVVESKTTTQDHTVVATE